MAIVINPAGEVQGAGDSRRGAAFESAVVASTWMGRIRNLQTRFTASLLASCLVVAAAPGVFAYTIGRTLPRHPPNHETSVLDACARAARSDGLAMPCVEQDVVAGVREPDILGAPLEMMVQRVFGREGTRRNVSWDRVAIQHFHGSPLPLIVRSAAQAQSEGFVPIDFAATLPLAVRPELGPSARSDLWATVTMGQLRNKMLSQAAAWVCVGLAHSDPAQRWRKLGNLAHMVGDTFSAAHALRSETGDGELLLSYSMDVVWWAQHVVGDEVNDDARFAALVAHLTDLVQLYTGAMAALSTFPGETKDELLPALNEQAKPIYDYLCERTWKMGPDTLARPAGGATKEWSSALKFGKSMLPAGLTSAAAYRSYVAEAARRTPGFFYPHTDAGDYCGNERQALDCNWELEVEPARKNAENTRTMLVPQVDRSRPPSRH